MPTQDTDVLKVKSDGLIVGAASAQENAVTLSGATGEFGLFVSIGPVGRGSLTLRNGAQTTSRTMDLGFSAGGEATLLLDGTLLPVVAKVEDELLVAQDGHTRVELTGNAELEAEKLHRRWRPFDRPGGSHSHGRSGRSAVQCVRHAARRQR